MPWVLSVDGTQLVWRKREMIDLKTLSDEELEDHIEFLDRYKSGCQYDMVMTVVAEKFEAIREQRRRDNGPVSIVTRKETP